MRIIGVIPARYSSSRFPGKPLADICGHPMVWWTYQQAKKVVDFEKVLIATDSELIKEACDRFSMEVMMTSEKHQTGTDRLAEVAVREKADLYVNVQGDEPLIEPEVIERLIRYMTDHPDCLCCTIHSAITDPVDVVNTTVSKVVFDVNGNVMYISKNPIPYPKASLNYSYYKALGIYAFREKALDVYRNNAKATYEQIEEIEMLRLVEHGVTVHTIEVPSESPSVDTPKDLERIKKIMGERNITV